MSHRATVRSAGHLENMAWRRRRIRVKSAYPGIAYGQVGSYHRGIESNAQHRAQRQNRVVISYIHPVSLCFSAGTKIEPDPDVGVVCSHNCDAGILRRVLDLIDERTIS